MSQPAGESSLGYNQERLPGPLRGCCQQIALTSQIPTLYSATSFMVYTRFHAAGAVVLVAAWVAQFQGLVAAERSPQPNIVLVLADDLGVFDLGCYGRSEHPTPHLDRLAREGARFTAAYTAQPICSPSRAAIMTGKCPARLHLTNFLPGRADAPSQPLRQPVIEGQLPLEERTLAELLRDAGYATGLFGKWHLGGKGFEPQDQGFDRVVSPPANTPPTLESGGKGEFAITAAAEKFMEENRDRPFFCYVPHNNPHIPLAAAPEMVERHKDAFHPVYAAMIETLDQAVGRLMAKVESLGLADRTIFVFTSDNGGLHVLEFPGTPATHNGPFRAGKGYVYEGGLRVPLIVRWPGASAGAVIESPVLLTDLMPTLLQAAGVDVATTVGPLDGVSIAGVLQGQPPPERTLFWHFPNYTNQGGRPAGAVRQGDWKLIEQYDDGSLELYDLAADESETRNLAAEQPAKAKELAEKLAAWRERVGAQMPEKNEPFDRALYEALYVAVDPSSLAAPPRAAELDPNWTEWRRRMNQAVQGQKPRVTPAGGDIRLFAKDARLHASVMRYEPEPHKNVLGYWTNPADWAEWEFDAPADGVYEVEVQQGCGEGSGGAVVQVEVSPATGPADGEVQTLAFTVQDTGHFQQMIQKTIGQATLTAGRWKIAVKPQTKPGVAVMDLRRIVLRPVR